MSKKNPTDEEKLRALWYKKLKEDGFEDIEDDRGELKVWTTSVFSRSRNQVQNGGWEAKAAYYSMASKFLQDYPFADNLERAIWEYHSEGISVRDIVKTLNKLKRKTKTNRAKVWKTINRLEKVMKYMYLADDQNNEQ